MALLQFLTFWRSGASIAQPNIQTPDRFRGIVERERKRADRNGQTLSLLLLTLPGEQSRDAELARLSDVFDARLRATDVAGLLHDGRIGVLLPETAAENARDVARDIAERFAGTIPPHIEISTYPDGGNRAGSDVAALKLHQSSSHAAVVSAMFVKRMPVWKRTIDIVGASAGLLLLSPLLLATAALIRLTSPGPALFLQKRSGLGGQPFTIYKFRTMTVDAEAQKAALRKHSEQDGPAFKMQHDPRITVIGKYLRKTCIDELPQLLNVLKGDMSLVGPRPLPVDESNKCENWQLRRLEVTPGLTCIWQLDGKSRVPFTEWMRMDLRYIRKRSIKQDVTLVFRTMLAVIMHRASH